MDALKWPLFFLWLCFNVVQTEASSWSINVPSTVRGQPGSCVVIPCTFRYPGNKKDVTKFTGIWMEENNFVYHPDKSQIVNKYRNSTELLGDITQNNCSLKIDPLKQSDTFYFRILLENLDNFSYKQHMVSILMTGNTDLALSIPGDVAEGQTVVVHCSMSPSCPTSPPVFSWSHSGEEHFHSLQFDDEQWKATAALTFHPTSADHNKPLVCTVQYSGGQRHETFKVLKVKHAPVNVKVEYGSDVKEGEAVQLKCSSDAYPSASDYKWFSEAGVQLHEGNIYTMSNISRHMGALYCTAMNTVGKGKSSLVHLSVLYAPEIKSVSSCSSEQGMVKCVCIVESQPPCMVHFVLSETVLPGTEIERHGSVTIGTLQADFESSEFVRCLANNTEGYANLVLSLPVKGEMKNLSIAIAIAIATGACVVLVILLLAVGLKKYRGTSEDTPTPHLSTVRDNKEELSECPAAKRKDKNNRARHPKHNVSERVYGNMEIDWDDAIYANM